jgi:hypothetical protein
MAGNEAWCRNVGWGFSNEEPKNRTKNPERSPPSNRLGTEVTKADGKVVWEFHLGSDIGVYRAARITPPLVKAISQ